LGFIRKKECFLLVGDKKRPGIFYGWWVVMAAFVGHALSGGFYFYGFSAFFVPLIREFGWSRTAISGAFSLSRIEGGLLGPVGGFLVDKFGPRKMMFLGVAIMAAGFIMLSRINSLTSFYLVFILSIALGTTLAFHQASLVAIANWFIKKRGMAMGIGLSGVGLGGMLVPLLAWLIVQYGWRSTAVIIGAILLVVGIPLSLVMRNRPEQYGYRPDGETGEGETGQKGEELASQNGLSSATLTEQMAGGEDVDFSPRQAMKTAVFWLLALIFGLRQLVISAVVVHQIPFLTDLGISPEVAATMLAGIAVISIAGRLGFGRLADVLEKRFVMAICLALTAVGCLILANAQVLWHIVIFLVIYSPGYGGGAIVMNTLRAEYFGRQYFGTITGFMNLFQMFGTVLGPIFAGWVFDTSGSYRLAFITFAVSAITAMVLVLVARRPIPAPDGVMTN